MVFSSDKDKILKYGLAASKVKQHMTNFSKTIVRPFISRVVDTRLRVSPGSPNYPLKWKSHFQQIMFFVTKGFGHGIPYVRTNKLAKSWKVRGYYERVGGSITVSNSDPKAQWVIGENQQPFHTITGWPYATDILGEAFEQANSMMESEFLRFTRYGK
jgi:hypothetical protein